jgi:hypothetical protein
VYHGDLRSLGAGEFREGKIESQARFRTLILVEMILQQRITAAAGRGIVKWLTEIVPPKEPLEASASRLVPKFIAGHCERL